MTHTGTLSSNIAELYEVDHGKNMNPKMYLRIFEFVSTALNVQYFVATKLYLSRSCKSSN